MRRKSSQRTPWSEGRAEQGKRRAEPFTFQAGLGQGQARPHEPSRLPLNLGKPSLNRFLWSNCLLVGS